MGISTSCGIGMLTGVGIELGVETPLRFHHNPEGRRNPPGAGYCFVTSQIDL